MPEFTLSTTFVMTGSLNQVSTSAYGFATVEVSDLIDGDHCVVRSLRGGPFVPFFAGPC
jgi:hypothetical protein